MKHPLISIIVPVYNCEKYIEECLRSVLNQKFQDYEVIVVNDGSKDDSLKICEKICAADARIKLFTTENKGVSHARNYGIDRANGRWILFLDSDDYLNDGALQVLQGAICDDVQEICGNYVTGTSKTMQSMSAYVKPEQIITMMLDPANQNALPSFYHLESATLHGIWGKLFLRDIICSNHIRFDEKLKLSEDMFFHIQYLKKIQNVLLLNEAIFCYRQNEQSVTKNFKEDYIDNRIYLFEQLKYNQINADTFVASTMLMLNGQVEKFVSGKQRKALENKIALFWKENKNVLLHLKSKKISVGRWQNIVYKICAELFIRDLYSVAFLFLRLYVNIK